jgi:hypothetical protein
MGGVRVFNKTFIEVLKYHAPGLAPVRDETGAYHIDSNGRELYSERYSRTFGYYCNRAAVNDGKRWLHLTEKGVSAYESRFSWAGNFQEDLCPVRDIDQNYFHINVSGHRRYTDNFKYCGDFKDGIACVKLGNGLYRHIDEVGKFIHNREFIDLGIFHKNYATAKDHNGWHHIDKNGKEIYTQRYLSIEPFYNGFALVTQFSGRKIIIDESGRKAIEI